jgi:hypothetical protein
MSLSMPTSEIISVLDRNRSVTALKTLVRFDCPKNPQSPSMKPLLSSPSSVFRWPLLFTRNADARP